MTGHRSVKTHIVEADLQDPAADRHGLLRPCQQVQAKFMDLGWVGQHGVGCAGNPFAEADGLRQFHLQDSQCFFEEDIQGERLFRAVRLSTDHEHLCDEITSPFRREDYLLDVAMDATVRHE